MQYSAKEFELLYHQCFPPAIKLAMSMLHVEDDARDVVHEVFLKLWESKSEIENPMAFIIRSVRNSCINRINKLNNREKIEQRLMLHHPPDDTDISQRSEEVLLAVDVLLTSREKDVVEKIYSQGMSYKETAENLNISTSTVNKNLVSALKKLRNHFKTSR